MKENKQTRKREAFYLSGFSISLPTIFTHRHQLFDDIGDKNKEKFYNWTLDFAFGRRKSIDKQVSKFESLIKKFRPRIIFMIDDVRTYAPIIIAAKGTSTPTYALQHGHFTKYHVGWRNMNTGKGILVTPDRLIVWSKYWKYILASINSVFKDENLMIGNPKNTDLGNTEKLDELMDQKKRYIVVPYESDAPHEEVRLYIESILEATEYNILFKTRTDLPKEKQMKDYQLTDSDRVIAVDSLESYTGQIAACVGVYSTFLYQMVLEGIPAGILDTEMDYGYGMVENGIADKIEKNQMYQQIEELVNMSLDERKTRYAKLNEGSVPLEETLKRILESCKE